MGQYVQYGCGWCAPRSWRNFDASPTLRFERFPIVGKLYTKNGRRFPKNVEYGDIVKGLPIPDGSCTAVYCAHVLEHLSLADFRVALRNTAKLLEPNGVFRAVLPDLEYFVRKYISDDSPKAAQTFMEETMLGVPVRHRDLTSFLVDWLGNNKHLWLWDYKGLRQELISAGFSSVRRATFGDSEITAFHAVEELDRWENCLGIECRK